MRKNSSLSGLMAVAAIAAMSLAPSASAAKKHTVKFKFVCHGGLVGSSQAGGKCTSNLGKAKYLLNLSAVPKITNVYKFKGGSIKMSGTLKLGSNGLAVGTYKIVGGTGKFKGAKGKGTVKADTRPGKPTIDKGTIKY